MALNFPDSPSVGDTYNDTNSGFVYEWDGTIWKSLYGAVDADISADSTPQLGGDLDLNSKDITGTGNINITGIVTTSELHVGVDTGFFTEDLVVNGDARITGILSIGTATITLDPSTNKIQIGTGITLDANTNTIEVGGSKIADTSGNAEYSGIVTATSFVGDLTGNADTATQLATARTIAGVSFDGTSNISLNNNTITNGAGFITSSDNISGTSGGLSGSPSIIVTDITAVGNVSIAGTLTYEDVTSVDAIGVVTARTGVRVTTGGIEVSAGGAAITGVVTATSFVGDITGNADTATTLETARNFSASGDATASSVSFNGSGDVDLALTLANSGVTAATYGSSSAIPSITVDAKGRITSATTSSISIDSTSVSNGTASVSVASNGPITSTGNHDFTAGIDVTGNITVTGTVDGRDVATDGSKLDGIESGATADQTASEILTAIKTVDGSGSGLDADSLDGYTWDSSGKNVRASEFYADNWFRNYNSGEGLYNQATGAHWYSSADGYWELTGNTQDQGTSLRFRGTYNGNTEGWIHANGSGWFGFLNNAGQWALRHYNVDGYSPNLYFDESGNETWTGNPGNDQGKIEYHSNRFYIASGANSTYVCQFRRSGSDVCRVENSGTVFSSGNFNSSSDIKLKTNIKTLTNSLDKVLQMRGVEYDRIDMEGEHQIGVIAQEVEKVAPELVSINDDDGLKSVSYGNITAILIEAMKEQQAQIEELKKEIKELKGES